MEHPGTPKGPQAVTQYELWWASLPAPVGRRPVLLLSRPSAYEFLTRFIAAEITTRVRGIPQEVELGKREGMRERCVVNFDNLRTVSIRELDEQIGAVAPRREAELKRAMGAALGWPELVIPARE